MSEHAEDRNHICRRRLAGHRHLTQHHDTEAAQHSPTPTAPANLTWPFPGAVPLLGHLDPATAPAHPVIITAAIAHSQNVPDPTTRLAWTRYAHTNSYQLRGPYDPTTRQATLLYAMALTEHGRVLDAYRLHRHRLVVAQVLGQPGELIPAHRHLAEARHAISQCDQATAEIHHALILWHGHRQPAGEGARLLASYATILASCGHTRAARRTLRTYPDLLPNNDTGFTNLAQRIVYAQETHPPLCRRHPTRRPPKTPTAQRLADWHYTLRRLRFPPTTVAPNLRGPRHDQRT